MVPRSHYDECLQTLKRIAWKLQYRAKLQRRREVLITSDNFLYATTENSTDVLSKIYVEQLLEIIPSVSARSVIKKIYVEDKTEKEVAYELNITQQAVSKWKKRGLQMIFQRISSHSY